MKTRLAINGFGRIGRMVLRALIENPRDDMQLVAINDLGKAQHLAHLLKYDSVHGNFPGTIEATETSITVNGHKIDVISERSPKNLPWRSYDIDIVMECTGFFLTQELCQDHISAGAKRVLMSAPSKDKTKTIVYGINEDRIDADDVFISNASCTTNALAPLAHILHENYGIVSGIMTTVHAYTGDQPTHDSMHKDLYRGRAAALSMVPTTTGAAKAIGRVLPELAGKLEGVAVRVPVANVSMVDLTILTQTPVTADGVREVFKAESQGRLNGILGYIDEKLVSSDLNHTSASSSFVADQVYVNNKTLLRVLAWYDNEWAFSNRMLDTASVMAKLLPAR